MAYTRDVYVHFIAFLELLGDFGELGCPDLYIDRMCFLLERCKSFLRRMSEGQAKKAKHHLNWFLSTAYLIKEDRRPEVFRRVAQQETDILRLRDRIQALESNCTCTASSEPMSLTPCPSNSVSEAKLSDVVQTEAGVQRFYGVHAD